MISWLALLYLGVVFVAAVKDLRGTSPGATIRYRG